VEDELGRRFGGIEAWPLIEVGVVGHAPLSWI